MSIPMQHECNADDPEEHALWALAGLPGVKGAPMILHPHHLRQWSKHLHDLGFRHHPEHQKHEYHPPLRGPKHWANQSGRWVPKGTKKPPQVVAPDMSAFTREEKADIIKQLMASGELKDIVDSGEAKPAITQKTIHAPGAARVSTVEDKRRTAS